MGGHDHCAVFGCNNTRGKAGCEHLSFHRIPKGPKAQRAAWIRAINRKEPATNNWVVCSAHFVQNRPSKEQGNVDYVPSINMGKPAKPESVGSTLRLADRMALRLREAARCKQDHTANSTDEIEDGVILERSSVMEGGDGSSVTAVEYSDQELGVESPCNFGQVVHVETQTSPEDTASNRPGETRTQPSTESKKETKEIGIQVGPSSLPAKINMTGVDHDYLHTNTEPIPSTEDLVEKLKMYEAKVQRLQRNITSLEQQLNKVQLNIERIKDDDQLVRFYTGFPTFSALDAFYRYVEPRAMEMTRWRGNHTKEQQQPDFRNLAGLNRRKLSLFDELLAVLVRLRLGLLVIDIAVRMNISEGHFSRIFNTWLPFLAGELRNMMPFPPQQTVFSNIPDTFNDFPNTRIVIDCTEIYFQKPSALIAQRQTWSSYKHCNTLKALVGVTLDGYVSFVSDLWSGSVNDLEITKKSGLLELLNPKDNIMADKGFEIEEILPKGVTLNLPAFKPSQGRQFSKREVSDSQRIAAVRVHVERIIGRIKTFRLMDGHIPLSLQPLADHIFTTCCLLVNLQTPVVKVDK